MWSSTFLDEGGWHAYCPVLRGRGAVTQGASKAKCWKRWARGRQSCSSSRRRALEDIESRRHGGSNPLTGVLGFPAFTISTVFSRHGMPTYCWILSITCYAVTGWARTAWV